MAKTTKIKITGSSSTMGGCYSSGTDIGSALPYNLKWRIDKMNKGFFESNTKKGGLLIALGGIAIAVGKTITGDLSLVESIPLIIASIGVVMTLVGFRDAM